MSTWLIVALVGAVGELYFFFMQRSALEVCRARGLDEGMRFALLPSYYRAGRLPTVLKWAGIGGLVITGSWGTGVSIVIGALLVSAAAPVPRSAYFNIFYRELGDQTNDALPEIRSAVRAALESVDREFGITGR